MSKAKWAAIVYGRSYHLDFRFITIPQDFGESEIAWASPYILATTQKARHLADLSRWSLFKNKSHCIIGITCMVRDLIGKLGEDLIEVMAKDDRGRPLYVFVGYVTKLDNCQSLADLPAYTGRYLASFKSLYQEIEKVWWVRNYEDRQPRLSDYKSLNNTIETVSITSLQNDQILELNNQATNPDKTFLWQQSTNRNHQLWHAAASCPESTSICLDIYGKYLPNSPFLNQTISDLRGFTIVDRLNERKSERVESLPQKMSSSWKEKISNKAKGDIDLTLQQAAKVTSVSQEIISNFTSGSNSGNDNLERSNSSSEDRENFGFKTKQNPLPSKKEDWF